MRDGCPFCDYDGPSRVLHEFDEHVFVIEPIGPVTAGHVLVVPRLHVEHFADVETWAKQDAVVRTFIGACAWVQKIRRDEPTFAANLITSMGKAATQTVKHLHVHVVPRREGDGLGLPWADPEPEREPMCNYCGSLGWTVLNYGRITHKEHCPRRTDPWHQGDPYAE